MGFNVNIPNDGPTKTILAATDLFLNDDQSKAVTEGGAFLLAREGTEVPPQFHALVTDAGKPKAAKKPAGKKPAAKGRGKAKATKEIKPADDK